MALAIDACVAQHMGDRKEQQDRVVILPHQKQKGVALAALADGMGGHTGGTLAAEQVIHTAGTNLQHFAPAEEDAEQMLRSSLLEAHTMIKVSRYINEKEPHSTAVILLLQPGRASWAHCGDSRLYRFRGERLVGRTTDHSYVEHLVAAGQITLEQAENHPQRNILMTSLGGYDEPRIESGSTDDLAGGDSFLLCSDGLWAYFDEQELGGIIAGMTARQASEALIGRARERAGGNGDNVSLAIIKLAEMPARKPTFPRYR